MRSVRIGIIGCGTIGTFLARKIEEGFKEKASIVAICDIDKEKAQALKDSLAVCPLLLGIEELIEKTDLIIEAASKTISAEVARLCLLRSKDVMIMSVGGLVKGKDLLKLAEEKKAHLYIPSGAICGLDGVKAASMGRIDKVTLTTKKPPAALEGAPHIIKNQIDLSKIKEETVVFEGTAGDAVEAFPKNINVSMVLSLAGIGADKTQVKIITSPGYTRNVHALEVDGEFGRLKTETQNLPSPDNPKTSFLAMLSALATLKQILLHSKVGT